MNTARIAALSRLFGRQALAALLVVLLLLCSLASASPALHHLLHKDHQAPSHYCLVTMLEHGQTDVVCVWVAVAPVTGVLPVATQPVESFFISHDLTLHPERGPPVLS